MWACVFSSPVCFGLALCDAENHSEAEENSLSFPNKWVGPASFMLSGSVNVCSMQ